MSIVVLDYSLTPHIKHLDLSVAGSRSDACPICVESNAIYTANMIRERRNAVSLRYIPKLNKFIFSATHDKSSVWRKP